MHFLDLGCNDYVFDMISMLFDESKEKTFHLIDGTFMQKFQREQLRPSPLVKDVLLYYHGKVFGTRNEEAHEELGRGLRWVKDMFTLVRDTPFLKSYREMHWLILK